MPPISPRVSTHVPDLTRTLSTGSSHSSDSVRSTTGHAPRSPAHSHASSTGGVPTALPRGPAVVLRPRPTVISAGGADHVPAASVNTADALRAAQAAEARLPELKDRQAIDGKAAMQIDQVHLKLKQTWDRLSKTADEGIKARRETLTAANDKLNEAQEALANLQAQHASATRLLSETRRQQQDIRRDLGDVEKAIAKLESRASLGGASPDPSPSSSASQLDLLKQARTDLLDAQRELEEKLQEQQGAIPDLDHQVADAGKLVQTAQAKHSAADDALKQLEAAKTQAKDVFDAQEPSIATHADAAKSVVSALDGVREACKSGSDNALNAAHRTTLEQALAEQRGQIDTVQDVRRDQQARLDPGGDLHQDLTEAEARLAQHRAELAGAERDVGNLNRGIEESQQRIDGLKVRTGVRRLLHRGERLHGDERRQVVTDLRAARQTRSEQREQLRHAQRAAANARQQIGEAEPLVAQAQAAIDRQRNVVAQTDVELDKMRTRHGELSQELAGLQEWEADRGAAGSPEALRAAETQVDQARDELTSTRATAVLAETRIHTAMDSLVQALKPSTPASTSAPTSTTTAPRERLTLRQLMDAERGTTEARTGDTPPTGTPPARHLGQRMMDGVRGTAQGLSNRTSPLRVDVTIGPISHSTASTGPTTFNGGHAPGRTVTAAELGRRGQRAIDHKGSQAAQTAATQLTGKPETLRFGRQNAPATTPDALQSAAAFTKEVSGLFKPSEADGVAGLGPTVLANRLLDHPNPDPVKRPDGHHLRHEQALLVASALSSVTTDAAQAAKVYNALWNGGPDLPGVQRRAADEPSPLASLTSGPGLPADPDHENTMKLAHQARRVLASSPNGMEALMNLQGMSLPAEGAPDRAQAQRAIEHYKLTLRAETALQGKLDIQGDQSTERVLEAVNAAPALTRDPAMLGAGKTRRGGLGEVHEDSSTLAIQAFKYAQANMSRRDGEPELHPEFKPAYVALRNGFTESGQKSDFNAMAKRLHKFVHHIDVAIEEKPNAATMAGRFARQVMRVGGQEMSPFSTLLETGRMGVELGQVPAEYKKQLGKAVSESRTLMDTHLRAHAADMTPADRAKGLTHLAAMEQWEAKLKDQTDPYASIEVSPEAVKARVAELAQEIFAPPRAASPAGSTAGSGTGAIPAAPSRSGSVASSTAPFNLAAHLDTNTLNRECDTHLKQPLTPKTLDTWMGKSKAAGPVPKNDEQLSKLRESYAMLQGKGQFVSDLADRQKEFDRATTPHERREVLRKLLIGVVASGDVADYTAGRKTAIAGRVGFSAGGVAVGDKTVGFTPVVEASVDRTKATVLRAGVASSSGVIYLGEEKKWGGSLGVGVRAGLTHGVGDFSVGAVARLGGTHSSSTGLMIRTHKKGEEHKNFSDADKARMQSDEDSWKRMSEQVVNTIFDLADAADRPENPNQMWKEVVAKLGDHHDISFGYNRGSATSASWSLQADGLATARIGPEDKKLPKGQHEPAGFKESISAGGQITAGIKRTFFNKSQATETGGAMRVFQGTSAKRTTGSAGGDIGVSHPVFRTGDGGTVMLLSRSKVGIESEMIFGGSSGLVRLTTENGRINPDTSFKHREFSVEGDFFKLMNAQRAEWAPHLGERGPDGLMHGGEKALDKFMADLANLPKGKNRVFIERKSMRPEAAETVNAYLSRLDVLQNGMQQHVANGTQPPAAMKTEIQALRQSIANEVNKEDNWQPFRLFVNETNSVATESGTAVEGRYNAPPRTDDATTQPDNADEAFRNGGGKFVIGAPVRVARGGRDLLTIDAAPKEA
ncbi:hypothetical protein AACH06_23295 [Ideonella sp. DXS29W]|uniref:Uncharacterized protein n=1 Tax=Ideonella lacteola TaxID=2984193 RepID=A0ABU9BUV5_9BURK